VGELGLGGANEKPYEKAVSSGNSLRDRKPTVRIVTMSAIQKPELILCDLGGVLYTLDYERTWSLFQHCCNKTYGEIRDILYDDAFISLEKGKISPMQYHREVSRRLGCEMSFEEFKETFNAFLLKREEMFGIFSRLIAFVPVHFLSNTNAINAELLREDLSGIRAGSTLSFETGFRKPEPEIYRIALEMSGTSAEDTVFIDDSEENVRAAEEVGIRSHLFTGKNGLLRFLENEGIRRA
jgi:FMN phosphatase YigB (HAD superfamily)